MQPLYATLLMVFNTFCLFLLVVGLPGYWLMLLAAGLLAWWQWAPGEPWGEQMFHPATLMVAVGLGFVGEIIEFLLGAAGSRKFGGTWRGAAGAIVGGIAGGIIGTFALPIPLVGSLLGACIGAFAGAMAGELSGGGQLGMSLESGRGAAIGRFWGTVAKLAVGVVIWLILGVAAFF